MKDSSKIIMQSLSNSELAKVHKEILRIKRSTSPVSLRKSKLMNRLLTAEMSPYRFWSEQFHSVSVECENEIARRIDAGIYI